MRRVLDRISPVLLVSVMVGGFVVMSTLPATAEQPSDRLDHLHAERPDAASLHYDDVATITTDAAYVPPAEPVAAPEPAPAPAPNLPTRGTGAWSAPVRGACNDNVSCFLECTRAHESDSSGGYAAVSSGGQYRGAYQFMQSTWDAAVAGAGWAEYAGIPADQAPPEIQDAAAAHLYSVSGNRPWNGRC